MIHVDESQSRPASKFFGSKLLPSYASDPQSIIQIEGPSRKFQSSCGAAVTLVVCDWTLS